MKIQKGSVKIQVKKTVELTQEVINLTVETKTEFKYFCLKVKEYQDLVLALSELPKEVNEL